MSSYLVAIAVGEFESVEGVSDSIPIRIWSTPGKKQLGTFALDGAKWLVGDEGITGEVTNENDVPIVHTKKQDQVWFYGSSFLAPALVLGIGFLVAGRRRGRAVRKEKQS